MERYNTVVNLNSDLYSFQVASGLFLFTLSGVFCDWMYDSVHHTSDCGTCCEKCCSLFSAQPLLTSHFRELPQHGNDTAQNVISIEVRILAFVGNFVENHCGKGETIQYW